MEQSSNPPLSDAETAFLNFLVSRSDEPSTDFDEFCEARPQLREELCRLYENWFNVQTVAQQLDRRSKDKEDTVSKQIERRHGKGIDPGITLDGEEDSDAASRLPAEDTDAQARLLERLTYHRPQKSRYKVKSEIAHGGMGAVLKIWDEDLRRNLAMKVILGKRLRDGDGATPFIEPQRLSRFMEEAQVTGQLEHPGILPVHELGLDAKGQVYYTMPLVRGRNFKTIIQAVHEQEDGWTVTRALSVILRVCEAMAYAHSKHVIHRDIKPANIMVGRFGEVYVMDWGLARVLGRKETRDLRIKTSRSEESGFTVTQIETERAWQKEHTPDSALETMDGDVVGTPSYMPPEQAEGRTDELGPRSDVYAIGAMLYHLLAGQMPYLPMGVRVSPHTVLAALLNGPPKPIQKINPEAPDELVAICDKAMARDQRDRYASAAELAEDVQAYLEHRPVTAREHTLGELAGLAVRRHKPVVSTALAAAVVLVVSTLYFVFNLQESYASLQDETTAKEWATGIHTARSLLDESKEFAPFLRDVPQANNWLEQVDELLPRRGEYEAGLAQLAEDDPTHAEVAATVAAMASLAELRPRIERWRDEALTLAERTVSDYADLWEQARSVVADSDVYEGIDLKPQIGLVPLKDNPFGLYEFLYVPSGDFPEIDPEAKGGYRLFPETGIILVLLPGGDFKFGDDRSGYLVQDENGEPVPENWVTETVEPFFLAKYEVTQAQWARLMESTVSTYKAGLTLPEIYATEHTPKPITSLHPVETVSWYDATQFADRMALRLPTEREWEYAARAGSEEYFYFGAHPLNLVGHENIRDRSAWGLLDNVGDYLPNDGYAVHAPVGTFSPNGFGLLDMHGNVSEWTANPSVDDWVSDRKIFRGGSWTHPGVMSSSSFRHYRPARFTETYLGFRVALDLEQ